ncbi:MAG TPA: hypothetical protein VF982_00345, partial [Anaerolineales bacterium]
MKNRFGQAVLARILGLWLAFSAIHNLCAAPQGLGFEDIAARSGLTFTSVSGTPGRKDYILESTGS